MVSTYLKLAMGKAFSGRILPLLALVCFASSWFFAACSLMDEDGDGHISGVEMKEFFSQTVKKYLWRTPP